MKRWLVILLIALALLILITPGIVGRMAEKNIESNIEWAESDSSGVSIETERFERGWFTSEGRHRIVLEGGRFREVSEQYRAATGNAELPSLIIDTQLAHGPLPGGSMSPGLANAVSTFQIDPGNGEVFEVPGSLTSNVGLDGRSASHLLLDAGNFQQDSAVFSWQGADMNFDSNPATGALSVNGEIKPWKLSADDTVVDFSAVEVTADQTRSDFGFDVGSVNVQTGEITLAEGSNTFSIAGISLTADTAIDDDRLNAESTFSLNSMTIPAVGDVDFMLDFMLEGADAASIKVIGDAMQDAQSSIDPEAAMANVYSQVEDELQTMFQKGFSMRLDKMDVSLPQGVISTRLELDVPESGGDFDWASVMLNSTGSLDVRIPGAIYEMAAMMNAQAGSLVAMGILKQDGDDYVIDAEYAQGLFNVNGVPMPIPMPTP